jgi:hypothetical protein
MNVERKAILDRIKHLEDAILRAREYLKSEQNASWHGFRPLFSSKTREGKTLPPHKDWVRGVFLPKSENALLHAYKKLERLSDVNDKRRGSRG